MAMKPWMSNYIPWWRHQMETFSAWLALCAGNSPIPVNSPHKGQWRGALMFSLICVWINGWVNNRKAGDLSRHRAHYDVIVMPHKKNHGMKVRYTSKLHCHENNANKRGPAEIPRPSGCFRCRSFWSCALLVRIPMQLPPNHGKSLSGTIQDIR